MTNLEVRVDDFVVFHYDTDLTNSRGVAVEKVDDKGFEGKDYSVNETQSRYRRFNFDKVSNLALLFPGELFKVVDLEELEDLADFCFDDYDALKEQKEIVLANLAIINNPEYISVDVEKNFGYWRLSKKVDEQKLLQEIVTSLFTKLLSI